MNSASRGFRIAATLFAALSVMCFVPETCRTAQPESRPETEPRPFPSDGISPDLPYDVNVDKVRSLVDGRNIRAAHAEFDILAWQAFIALNWPAAADGRPSITKSIADTGAPRVWEFWRPADTIFLAEGARPPQWSGKLQKSTHYGWKAAWRPHTTVASNTEAFSGPLVDQNGNWARYQIRVNREEFDYIFDNELYSQDGQVEFSHRRTNNQVELPLNHGKRRHGAIEIKLAWKELGANDDASRFFTQEITSQLSEPPGPDNKPVPPRTFKAGLVGMHISMRTQSSPEWIWATFEQIDNNRVNKYADGRPTHPNFFKPGSPPPFNALPQMNASQDPITGVFTVTNTGSVWVEHLTKTPVQVQRIAVPTQLGLNPLDASLAQVAKVLNEQVQEQLRKANSVFQYYELIDAQWPLHPDAPACAGGNSSAPESITHKTPGDMVPVFNVNTTMETYFQKGQQQAGALEQDDRLPPFPLSPLNYTIDPTTVFGTESCVGCHYSSGITISFKKDLATGKEIVDKNGIPTQVVGENNHFGRTGSASYSWMLQLEPKARRRNIHDPSVILIEAK
jgi:hypothetical protein